jgi:hypothetical protein
VLAVAVVIVVAASSVLSDHEMRAVRYSDMCCALLRQIVTCSLASLSQGIIAAAYPALQLRRSIQIVKCANAVQFTCTILQLI